MVHVASKPEQSLGPGAASEVLSRGVSMPWIDGAAHPSAARERAQVTNPATKEPLIELELAGRDDVDAAVEAARRAFEMTVSSYGAEFGVQAVQDHLEERSVIIQL